MGAKARKPSASSAPAVAELGIEALGGRGDGIGHVSGRLVFVPLTAPGDRVRVALGQRRGDGVGGTLLDVLSPSPVRRTPSCGHFGDCGGCAVQHLDEAVYAEWKRGLVVAALAHRGLGDVEVRPPVRVAPGTRRRVTLAAVRHGGRVRLGFSARATHRIVDLRECTVAAHGIVALLAPLRAALAALLREGEQVEAVLTLTETGADLLLVGARPPDLAAREALAAFAEAQDIARLSWSAPGGSAEPIAWRRAARVRFGGVAVELPPGAFLQPTAEGEAALAGVVAGAMAGAGRVLDLFAGCGTFSFPLAAAGGAVHAVEGVDDCVAAIRRAAGEAGLGGRVSAEVRDLERRPLAPEELERFAAVVFDPPRVGARAQSEMLARSAVATVVAVSCNPATFARDARILVDGGYRLGAVTPVDQFLWSAHVELVAVFSR